MQNATLDTQKLQAEIDQLVYPPTHTYTLDPLEPTGVLALRFAHLQRLAPTFFKGKSLLDVGASKGFYSLWAAAHGFERIVAIEPTEEYANLLRRLLPSAIIRQEKFGDFCKEHRPLLPNFDRILVTNAHHYLFGEYGSYAFWDDIAALCYDGAQVVTEGPTDQRSDIFVPKLVGEMAAQYNTGSFFNAPLQAGFELHGVADSPELTSDRCVLSLTRRGRRYSVGDDRRIQKGSLQVREMLREGGAEHAHRVYRSFGGLFCKEHEDLHRDAEYNLARLQVASKSPYSIPIQAFIYDGNKLAGWAEPDMTDALHWYHQGANKKECANLLKTICLYQIGLAEDGYLDLDNGSANWCCDRMGRQYACDKGAVHGIARRPDASIHSNPSCQQAFQVPADYATDDWKQFREGSFFRLAHREYAEWMTKPHERAISEAVQAADKAGIQKAFFNLYQSIGKAP